MGIDDIMDERGTGSLPSDPARAPANQTPDREPGEVVERKGTLPDQMPVNRTTVRDLQASVSNRNEGVLDDPPEPERAGGDENTADPEASGATAQQRESPGRDRSKQERKEAKRREKETKNADADNGRSLKERLTDEDGYLPGTRPPDFEIKGDWGEVSSVGAVLAIVGERL